LPFGVDGRRAVDEPPPPRGTHLAAVDALLDSAAQLLAADGRVPRGLSTLADVIESAAAEADEYNL
jgi:hypothetical protein